MTGGGALVAFGAVDPLIRLAATGLIAIVFARALLEKATHYQIYAATLRDYRLVPAALAPLAAAGLFAAEAATLAALLLPAFLPPAFAAAGAFAAIALLLLYAAAMSLALAAGRTQIECGCGGEGQLVSLGLVARNIALALIALLAAQPPSARAPGWLDMALAVLAILTGWPVLASAEKAIENAAAIRRLHNQSYL